MSVRPIDIQQIVAKAEDVERIQETQQQQPRMQQGHFATELQQQQEVKKRQAPPSPRSEEAKIREEAYNARQRRYQLGKRKKQKEDMKDKVTAERKNIKKEGQIIDIKA